jgi:hypothetical protein
LELEGVLFDDKERKLGGVLDGNLDPLLLAKTRVGKEDPEGWILGIMDFRSFFGSFEFLVKTGMEEVSCRDGFLLLRDITGRADFFPWEGAEL